MPHALTLGWYVVPAAIVAIASLIVFVIASGMYFSERAREYSVYARRCATIAIVAFFMVIFGAWIWPVTLFVAMTFILFKLVGEFIPSKEK